MPDQGDAVLVRNADGPREALFLHLVEDYRAQEGKEDRPICLTQAGRDLVAQIAAQHHNIHSEADCSWDGPGVILTATGEAAMWVHAEVDCADRVCAAEGGATYGNMGAEGWGYRIRRTRQGWTINKAGIMWIS